jgi:hypothetical protein
MEAAPPSDAKSPPSSAWPGGFGPYRFGLLRDEVRAIPDCQPYQDFASNSDFECPNLALDGKTRNISFHFDREGRLIKVQIWYAEDADLDTAVQAFLDIHEHFRAHFGAQPLAEGSRDLAANLLRPLPPLPGRIVVRPEGKVPDDVVVWAEVARLDKHGYDHMLYTGYPPAAPRQIRDGR